MENKVKVQYTLRRRAGQKRTYMRIQPDGSLLVSTNLSASTEYINSFVSQNWDWYQNAIRNKSLSHDFKDGDVFRLFGKSLTLEIQEGASWDGVCISGNLISVFSREVCPEEGTVRKLLMAEFKKRLADSLEIRLPYWSGKLALSEVPHFHINNTSRQWASCSSERELSFCLRCVTLEPELLDYLIAHELCHIFHMNHGKEFHALLESILPDCKARRKRLSSEYLDSYM